MIFFYINPHFVERNKDLFDNIHGIIKGNDIFDNLSEKTEIENILNGKINEKYKYVID